MSAADGAVGHLAIVGMGRSGSTFLEGLLADRLRGVALGELPGVWTAWQQPDKLCSCGQRARQCEFWSGVASRYAGLSRRATVRFVQQMNHETLPLRRLPSWPRVSARSRSAAGDTAARYLCEISKLYAALRTSARAAGYRTVVDSSKHPFWYHLANRGGALDPFEPRRAVRLVRHPRAVAFSLRRPRTEFTAAGATTVQNTYRLWQAIPYWLVMNLVADATTDDTAVVVRYEDLADPGVLDSLDTGFGGSLAGDSSRADALWSHQLVGNPSRQNPATRRFENDTRWSEQPIGVGEDLSWRALTPVLRRYGYAARPPG